MNGPKTRLKQNHAKEGVQDFEARFRCFSDANIIGIVYGDAEVITDANEAFLRMVDYSREELQAGKIRWLEITPPEYRERDKKGIEELLARGATAPYEKELCRRDGSRIWVLFGSAAIRRSPLLYVGFVMDFSERKRKEDRLCFHASLLEQARNPIIATDLEGKITYWNRAAAALYQWKEEEAVGKNVLDTIVVPEARDKAQTILQDLPVKSRIEGDFSLRRKDGTTFPAHVINSVVRDIQGKIAGLMSLTLDLTERKQMEDALRESESQYRSLTEKLEQRVQERTAELAKANEEIGAEILERREAEKTLRELSGQLLHLQDEEQRRIARELHDGTAQTLTALALNLALMKQQVASGSKRKMMATVAESLSLVEQASQEIRTFSYLLHPPELEGGNLAAAITSFVEGFGRRTKLNIDLDITSQASGLSRDVQKALFRVLQESLNNIYRHSGSSTAKVRMILSPETVVLEIKDQGQGIPSGIIKGELKSGASPGVGIPGMRERLRQLGGRLEVVSEPEDGTMIRAIVPVESDGGGMGSRRQL